MDISAVLSPSIFAERILSKSKFVSTGFFICKTRQFLSSSSAGAVNPYLALDTLHKLVAERSIDKEYTEAESAYIKAVVDGIVKIVCRLGSLNDNGHGGAHSCFYKIAFQRRDRQQGRYRQPALVHSPVGKDKGRSFSGFREPLAIPTNP